MNWLRGILVLLAAAGLVAAGWMGGIQRTPAGPPPSQAAPGEHRARMAALQAQIESLQQQIDERDLQIAGLRRRLDQAMKRDAAAAPDLPDALRFRVPDAAGETEVTVDMQTIQERMREAMESPEMKQLMESGRRLGITRMVERRYADLIGALGLDGEAASHLMDFLVERNMASTQGWLPFGAANAGQEAAEVAAIDQQIRAFLGEEQFQVYRRFEETIDARRDVGWFERRLSGLDSSLTDAQREQLVDVFHRYGDNRDDAGQWMRALTNEPTPDGSYAAGVEESLDETQARYQAILNSAENFLEDDQLQSLVGYLNEQMRQREMQAGIASQLFGGGGFE